MKFTNPNTYTREIPVSEKEGMRVPARIYGLPDILNSIDDGVYQQITNVARLPGIRKYAFCMPDGHQGYGFPIGGVAAFGLDDGVISPGGIGFDINCGVRLMRTNLTESEIKPKLKDLIDLLFRIIPAGVGKSGIITPKQSEFENLMVKGASWCKERGYAAEGDLECIEDYGCIKGGDPANVSEKAFKRGIDQIGTLGSGNHYLEIQKITGQDIWDQEVAKRLGLDRENQIAVMIHCGSRGFGHQIATDYLMEFTKAMKKYGLETGDRELACAPFSSPEGKRYFSAMACAANTAFVNRQVITHRVRQGFSEIFKKSPEELGLGLIYDVAHNIAKIEEFDINGKREKLLVHRKGSTRNLGPSSKLLPDKYKGIGQPVLVGGSMQTGSYLLVGTDESEQISFNSTVHGAGRTMSRTQAKKRIHGKDLFKQMTQEGIHIRTASFKGLAEEAGFAYKDIDSVVKSVEAAGISKPVLRLRPVANIKG